MKSSDAITLRGIDFVMFQVTDMPRARAFWETLLGLNPGAFDSEYYVEYDLPDGSTFALGKHPTQPHVAMGGIMFGVEHAEHGAERVTELGGTFHANFGGEICATAWCSDPDGNFFGLHQRRATT
ncbi:MAG: hypothetical protein KGN02_02045 [bacterium]|nr:hypothetical protein [bacterium]